MMTIIEKADELHKSVNTFLLSCVGEDGYPITKAVSSGKYRDKINEIYFCTNTSSKYAQSIAKNDKASIYFYSRMLVWKGCMLKGKMEIVQDIGEKEKYWQDKFKKAYAENHIPTLIFAY